MAPGKEDRVNFLSYGEMNDQLLSHLATFDSDEDVSVYSDIVAEEGVDTTLHQDTDSLGFLMLRRIRHLFDRFPRSGSWTESLVEIGWLLPIVIALSQYIGPSMSWSLGLIFYLIKVAPLRPNKSSKEDERGGSPREDGYRNVTMMRLQDCRSCSGSLEQSVECSDVRGSMFF